MHCQKGIIANQSSLCLPDSFNIVAPSPASNIIKVDTDSALTLARYDEGAELGDSIAVNGICLTVRSWHDELAIFDVSGETGDKTTLSGWRQGMRVNLPEPALALGDRLGGHLVSGHVDGVGRLLERRPAGNEERFYLRHP